MVEAQVGTTDEGRPIFRSEHIVRWSASEPGEAALCTIQRVPVTVVVKDAAGQPVAGTKVYGCELMGDTGPDGTLKAEAYSHHGCEVRSFSGHGGFFRPAVHAEGELVVVVDVCEPEPYDPAAKAEETRQMIEVYEGLLDVATTGEGKELLQSNLKRRQRLLSLERCHAGERDQCVEHGPMHPFSDRLPSPTWK